MQYVSIVTVLIDTLTFVILSKAKNLVSIGTVLFDTLNAFPLRGRWHEVPDEVKK